MEESKLKVICGSKVTNVEVNNEGTGILFENGINLVICNNLRLIGFSCGEEQLLINKVVADIDEDKYMITIKFENNLAIHIDMRDEAYNGPEAIQLRIPGDPIMIWN